MREDGRHGETAHDTKDEAEALDVLEVHRCAHAVARHILLEALVDFAARALEAANHLARAGQVDGSCPLAVRFRHLRFLGTLAQVVQREPAQALLVLFGGLWRCIDEFDQREFLLLL